VRLEEYLEAVNSEGGVTPAETLAGCGRLLILGVTPLVLQVYFRDHTGSFDIPNMDTQSEILNYHSDFLIGSTFQICSPIGNISITLPSYQWINDSDQAESRYDVYHL